MLNRPSDQSTDRPIYVTDNQSVMHSNMHTSSRVWTEKTKTTKKGGVVRKKVVGENFEAIRGGKPLVERSVKVDKFDKSGNLKKSTTITDSGKTVVRPGRDEVKKKVGFFAKSILNKNI